MRKIEPDPIIPSSRELIQVRTHEGSFLRRKRGTLRPAKLNESLSNNVSHAKVAGPSATKLVAKLRQYLVNMKPGRITLHIRNRFVKTLNQKGKMDYSQFGGFEIQEKYPLDKMLLEYKVIEKDNEFKLTIPINQFTIRSASKFVTNYYFELILLHGDPAKEKSLKIESTTSDLYPIIANPKKTLCTLTATLPSTKNPWMVFLKLNCHEGDQMALHPRHYPMRVVAIG
jgi:hypothetical protein